MYTTYVIYGGNEDEFENLLTEFKYDVALRQWDFDWYTNSYSALAEHFNDKPDFGYKFTIEQLGQIIENDLENPSF